ncbi:hypothetical protein HDU67_000919, partial [Dinochytrium kinnereticum]
MKIVRKPMLVFLILSLLVDGAARAAATSNATAEPWKTWCGLHYEVGSPAIIPPPPWEGTPPPPPKDWMVRQRLQPYTHEILGSFLLTPPNSLSEILPAPPSSNSSEDIEGQWARLLFRAVIQPDEFGQDSEMVVALKVVSIRRRTRSVSTARTAMDVEIPAHLPKARFHPYVVKCTLEPVDELEGLGKLETMMELRRVPPPEKGYMGNVVKLDTRTGATIVERLMEEGSWKSETVFPYGHYIGWGNFLENNFTILDQIKSEGYTVIHPVPPFDDSLDLFEKFLDHANNVGIYVQYDMRHTYKYLHLVTAQVKRFRSKPALIGWYTADEPDGTSDPPNLSLNSHETILAQDPYHPIALVLNCKSHGLTRYAQGADIIMTDAYMVDVNLTFSPVWGTPCNATYGCCGCDGCKGSVGDILERVEGYRAELEAVGMVKPIWAVLQGFGEEAFWP